MRVAELTVDQAAALDPATLQPGQAIAVRFSPTRVSVIGPIPSRFGPNILCAELRFRIRIDGVETEWAWAESPRVAPATNRGLRLLLAAMEGLSVGWRRAS